MSRDSSVGGFRFDCFAIGADKDGCHESQRAESLGNDVRLDVAVVVLARPDELSGGFQALSDHVVDKTMLIPDVRLFERGLVLGLVDFLENVFEAAVVLLQNRVFG